MFKTGFWIQITFWTCVLAVWIHKGYCLVKSWCEMFVLKHSGIHRMWLTSRKTVQNHFIVVQLIVYETIKWKLSSSETKLCNNKNISTFLLKDRAKRHDFWSRFFLFILLFFYPLILGGKRKEEKNNKSRGQKSCLSARSSWRA